MLENQLFWTPNPPPIVFPNFGETFFVTLITISWAPFLFFLEEPRLEVRYFMFFRSIHKFFRHIPFSSLGFFLKCFVEFHTLYVASPFRHFCWAHLNFFTLIFVLNWFEFWFHDFCCDFYFIFIFLGAKIKKKIRVILATLTRLNVREVGYFTIKLVTSRKNAGNTVVAKSCLQKDLENGVFWL